MQTGLFITFEGTDGSGKTTQIKLLEAYIKEKGYEVILSREPGGTRVSEIIRNIILDPDNKEIVPLTEMILYAASRAQHVAEVIQPAVESGKIVICDRYVDSSYAYQGAAIKRRINSTAADRIEQEKLDFHKRVYDGYKKLSVLYPDRIKTIDAANSVDDISAQIKEHIDELF
ncbi:MAG: thymidylate kinase [Eubacterium sp.]|nr:thymidylate kinase [Eubacterium sp.]